MTSGEAFRQTNGYRPLSGVIAPQARQVEIEERQHFEDEDDEILLHFDWLPERRESRITPVVKAGALLAFGLLLCAAGGVLLAYGSLSGTALLVLGVVVLVPGAYVNTIAFLAWRGVRGYSYDMLPSFF